MVNLLIDDSRFNRRVSFRLPIRSISLSRSNSRCYNRPKSYATVGLIQGVGEDPDGTKTVALDRDHSRVSAPLSGLLRVRREPSECNGSESAIGRGLQRPRACRSDPSTRSRI